MGGEHRHTSQRRRAIYAAVEAGGPGGRSVRAVADAVGCSVITARSDLVQLERQGRVVVERRGGWLVVRVAGAPPPPPEAPIESLRCEGSPYHVHRGGGAVGVAVGEQVITHNMAVRLTPRWIPVARADVPERLHRYLEAAERRAAEVTTCPS